MEKAIPEIHALMKRHGFTNFIVVASGGGDVLFASNGNGLECCLVISEAIRRQPELADVFQVAINQALETIEKTPEIDLTTLH